MMAVSTIKLSKAARYWTEREGEREGERGRKRQKDKCHLFFHCCKLLSLPLVYRRRQTSFKDVHPHSDTILLLYQI